MSSMKIEFRSSGSRSSEGPSPSPPCTAAPSPRLSSAARRHPQPHRASAGRPSEGTGGRGGSAPSSGRADGASMRPRISPLGPCRTRRLSRSLTSSSGAEGIGPGVERHVPALAVGEVEVREEGEATRPCDQPAARLSGAKRSKSIVSGSACKRSAGIPPRRKVWRLKSRGTPARRPRAARGSYARGRCRSRTSCQRRRAPRRGAAGPARGAMVDEDELTLRRSGKRPFHSLLMRRGEPNPVVVDRMSRTGRMPGSVKRDR